LAEIQIPDELRYSSDDEWVRVEEGRVTVGITDYAQQQLGDIVFVELPGAGASFKKGEAFGVVESVKAVSDLSAPISGEVIEVNDTLTDQPEAVNEACYTNGWMVAFAPSNPAEIDSLLDSAAYRKYVEERGD
jgi:glycine cleavage system H protein